MAKIHTLKTNGDIWDRIEAGEKTFEVRRDDRGFQKGDVVILERWRTDIYRPDFKGYGDEREVKTLSFQIGFVLTGGQYGLEPGHVVFSLKPLERDKARQAKEASE